MRERHNRATGKHPKTCSCVTCQQRRAEAATHRPKKKRKPKSQRGKGRKAADSDLMAEAMDILGLGGETRPEDDDSKGEDRDR